MTGLVLSSTGTLALLTGGALMLSRLGCSAGDESSDASSAGGIDHAERCQGLGTAGNITALSGFVLLSAGLPMLIYGAKKVPAGAAGASVTPWLAPDSAGLQLRVKL